MVVSMDECCSSIPMSPSSNSAPTRSPIDRASRLSHLMLQVIAERAPKALAHLL
jgi:hypothetical protein